MSIIERKTEVWQKSFSRRNFLTAGSALGASLALEHVLASMSPVDSRILDYLSIFGLVGLGKAEAASLPSNFDISIPGVLNGHFYTETRGDAPYPKGFAVIDNSEARFWSKFREFGGSDILGFPVSQRFAMDKLICQATQNFLLQQNPSLGGVVLANTLDLMHEKRFDDTLFKLGIPRHIEDDGSEGNPEKSKEIRRLWLSDPDIAKFYAKNPKCEELYGFATSKPEEMGAFIAQRFQRAVILKWIKKVDGGQLVGTIQFGNIGDIAKNIGIIPAEAKIPIDIPAGTMIEEEKYKVPLVFRTGDLAKPRDHITVDDGWKGNEKYLELMLNVAKDTGQKLTFFLVGSQMAAYPELVRRAHAEGHGLENHTYDHLRLSRVSDSEIRSQIRKQRDTVKAILNDPSYEQKFLRPPYGDGIFNYDPRIPRIAQEEGLKVAMWSIDNGSNVARTLSSITNGSIDLQHANPYDAEIFPRLIDENKRKGLLSISLEQGVR